MTDAQPSSAPFRDRFADRGPLLVALLALVIGLCLICVFAFLLLDGPGRIGFGGGPTPTPFSTSVAVAAEESLIVGMSDSTPISLTLNAPTTLNITGERFSVRAETVNEDGIWTPDLSEEGNNAVWVYGTLINYVLGVADNDENRALLDSLAPGDEVRLTMRDGTVYTFAVTSREVVSPGRADIFDQHTPGLTLVTLGARGDERLVVQGDYVVTESAGDGLSGSAGNAVELGETAQLGDVRVTVTGATSLFDRPEAPSGFIFYLVDFQMQNVGSAPLDTGNVRLMLTDDLGNQYALNPQASQLGNNPPLSGAIRPGTVRDATAGYQIPAGLTSPTLTWIVIVPGTNGEIRVNIPFAEGGEDALGSALIAVQSGEVSEDGTSVTLLGQITNNGSQPLVVEETDVSLASGGTVYLILSTNPGFPWVVPPGQTVPFSVSFQRPAGGDAVFTLLGQPFQISGLR